MRERHISALVRANSYQASEVRRFSRGIAEGAAYLPQLVYADSREVRLFDEQRYTHSLGLPEVIRSIGDRRCFHTGHENFFTVELIDAQGARIEYTVYFKLSRAPSKARLNLYVQSAYMQDDVPQRRPRPRKPIRFSVIAYKRACSFCGALLGPKGKDMLSVRHWECSACGAEHDRDQNAAGNIRYVGLRKRASVRGNELWHDTIPVEPDLPVRVRYGWGASYATA
jgi:hypothetical protein